MRLRALAGAAIGACLLLIPATVSAQTAEPSKLWLVGGGGYASFLVDCSECGDPEDYQHTSSLLVNVGRAITPRLDFGMELTWVGGEALTNDRARTSFLLAATQFRPWRSQGFFVKTGLGIAFIRNDVTFPGEDPVEFLSKGFSVLVGTGWEWRLRSRFGAQVYASLHAAAAGDIVTSFGTAQNVMVNYWSVGAAIVIR